MVSPNAATVWADGPTSVPTQPLKSDIRAWGISLENSIVTADQALAAASSAAASAAQAAAYAGVVVGSAARATYPPTRSAMAAQASTQIYSYLTEPGREGLFELQEGDFSNVGTIDSSQGIFVPLASAPTTKAYVRKDPKFLTPGMFGVPENATSGDHRQAVKDMFSAINSGRGNKWIIWDRNVVIPDGIPLGPLTEGITIQGVNGGSLTQTVGTATLAMLHFSTPITRLKISGMRFLQPGNASRATGATAVYIGTRCTDLIFENNEISDMSYGIWVVNGSRAIVRNNYVHDLWADGIHYGGGSVDGRIINNVVVGTKDDMIACTTDTDGGNSTVRTSGILIAGNKLRNGSGHTGNGVALYNCDNCIVVDNDMRDMQGNGVSIHTFTSAYPSLPTALKPKCSGIKVSDNTIYNVGLALTTLDGGTYVSERGHGHGIYVDGGVDIDISGNVIKKSNTSQNVYRAGIFLTSDTESLYDITLANNKITDIGGAGIRGHGPSTTGCDKVAISGTFIENTYAHAVDLTELYMSGSLTVTDTKAVNIDTQSSSRGMAFNAGITTCKFDTCGNFVPSGYSISLTGNAASWVRRNTANTF